MSKALECLCRVAYGATYVTHYKHTPTGFSYSIKWLGWDEDKIINSKSFDKFVINKMKAFGRALKEKNDND